MADFNHEFLEVADLVPAFVPVDMQTGANGVNWFNMSKAERVVCVLYKGAGTGGDNPVLTLLQATDNAGTGSKALTFTKIRTKVGAIATAANQIWTIVTQAAANTYTTSGAASVAMYAIEIKASDLDVSNGFNHVNFSIPDVGSNAQLGCAFYVAYGLKYPQQVTATFLD